MDKKPKKVTSEPAPDKSPRDIVKAAAIYFQSVTDNVDLTKLRLEEIGQDNKGWHVTLSYPVQDVDSIFGISNIRDYKEFLVDPRTATVKSMKIKKI
jgi:hypothetical protein